ncbi:MAG: IS1634 family transposase [Gemmatimonadales bacterium]
MTSPALPAGLHLESLEVGAAAVLRLLLLRLDLPALFERHLPPLPGRPPTLPSTVVLGVLLANLLLARQPLYALADWASRRVPEHLGLRPGQAAWLNDDRAGRALDHLHQADRASLLTALVRRAVTAFAIDLSELHQDTTTVTFSGGYAHQAPAEQANRPPRITFGYNKDHRPDLKQLLYSVTITADGAVPVHCKTYDGNTSDDQVHGDTWLFLRDLIGHSDFLYVADSKLCTRANLSLIADHRGRFLTVMPRTRSEDAWFRDGLLGQELAWREVHREPNPRRRDGPDVVYHGVESPQRSAEGYRLLWYRSSQKEEQDRQARAERLRRARVRLEQLRPPGRQRAFRNESQARAAGQRVLDEEQVGRWLRLHVDEDVEEDYRQRRPGRPGPDTAYRRIEIRRYRLRVEEDGEALAREARRDGLFPLMTNDATLSLEEALGKYKYQPFVEKRHEQLKTVFSVTPMWLKSVARVESLLWLYYVVELVQALLEREVRRRMQQAGKSSLALYPEGRVSVAPTAELVLGVLEGHRRHRLLDEQDRELRRFHDQVPEAAQDVLALLDVDPAAYGLD